MSETNPEIPDSPLSEATPDSVDNLLDDINNNLIEGMPERVTPEKLEALVRAYRAQAAHWAITEAEKKPRQKRTPGTKATKTIDFSDAAILDF